MFFAVLFHGYDTHLLTQNAKLKQPLLNVQRTLKGEPMDKYDVIGLVIAIVAVSVVLMH